MLAHILYAYEECNSKSNAKSILDLLIPEQNDFPAECSMFKEGEAVPDPTQMFANAKPTIIPAMHQWAKERGLPV